MLLYRKRSIPSSYAAGNTTVWQTTERQHMTNYAEQKFFPLIRAFAARFTEYDTEILIYSLEWQCELSRCNGFLMF